MSKEKILVVGANGQIGSVLVPALREAYGENNVIASDLREIKTSDGIYETLDALDKATMANIISKHGITQIYHLAAILSAKGEANPLKTWQINMDCLFNVLDLSHEKGIKKVFYPSTIAVFGSNIPKVKTPQTADRTPETVYGMSKVAGENWAAYYYKRYGLDVRSVRYPGIIGHQSLPGGGTTDYAVDIYYKAVAGEEFNCFLEAETKLPMLYMDDAIRATLELMEAPSNQISVRTSYNLAGMSFTPKEVYESIKKYYPDFKIRYQPDFRQAIAASWSESIDDKVARKDWGWKPKFNLPKMTADMLKNLKQKD